MLGKAPKLARARRPAAASSGRWSSAATSRSAPAPSCSPGRRSAPGDRRRPVLRPRAARIGERNLIGRGSVVDNDVSVGDRVRIQTSVYLTAFTTVEDDAFIGPGVICTNDNTMGRHGRDFALRGPQSAGQPDRRRGGAGAGSDDRRGGIRRGRRSRRRRRPRARGRDGRAGARRARSRGTRTCSSAGASRAPRRPQPPSAAAYEQRADRQREVARGGRFGHWQLDARRPLRHRRLAVDRRPVVGADRCRPRSRRCERVGVLALDDIEVPGRLRARAWRRAAGRSRPSPPPR